MCTKGMPVESPGPGVADSCIMGAGEETKILCRSPSVLNRWAISPALCIAGFVDLCPRVPVLGTKTSDMLFLMELWSSVLHRYSTNGEVDLAVLCPAWKLRNRKYEISSSCWGGSEWWAGVVSRLKQACSDLQCTNPRLGRLCGKQRICFTPFNQMFPNHFLSHYFDIQCLIL